MKGDPEFVILKPSAWLPAPDFEDKILGAIVKSFLKPTNAYVPVSPPPLEYNKYPLVTGSFSDFLVSSDALTTQSGSLSLRSLAGFNFHGSTEAGVNLQGKFIRYKRLQQQDEFWERLKEDESVNKRVPKWVKLFSTWPACLVTGIMICEDVEVSFEGKQAVEREGRVELPVGTIALAATGAPLPAGHGGNIQAGLQGGSNVATVFKAKNGQSSIFALELRKVTTEVLRRKELQLKEGGPKVDAGRFLADDDAEIEEEQPPAVEEMILDGFTEEDFAEMTG